MNIDPNIEAQIMPVIKKKFTLNTDNLNVRKLNRTTTEVQINTMLLDSAKKDLLDALTERNHIIKQLLLHEYEYILAPTDIVMYNDQLGEICVYEGKAVPTLYGR